MKFSVQTSDLQSLMASALSVSSPGASIRMIAERLGESLDPDDLESEERPAEPGTLRLVAFSETMVSEWRAPAEIRRAGSAAIHPEGIGQVARASKGADSTFIIELIDTETTPLLRLNTARSAHDFATESEAVFETVMAGRTDGIRGDLSNLATAISTARIAAANRSEAAGTRIALTGVHLRQRKAQIDVVGTDGIRLAVTSLQKGDIEAVDFGPHASSGFTLPPESLSPVIAMLQDGAARLQITETSALIENREGSLSVRLLDAVYPDYTQLLDTKLEDTIRLPKSAFEIALSRSSVAIARDKRMVAVKLSRGDDGIHLTSSAGGQSSSECLDETPGADISLGFDAKYMLDALGVHPKGDIILDFQGPSLPIRVTSPERPATRFFVMPCRTG